MNKLKDIFTYGSLFFSSLGIYLIAFFIHGPHPLGYDTGFYRRYLIEPVTSFPNAPVPGLSDLALLPRILLDLVRHIPLSTDIILYGTFIFLMALTPPLLFFALKKSAGAYTAYAAAVALVLSSVSYDLFWFMLFKQAFALPLFIIFLFALSQNKYWIAAFMGAAIFLSHVTTSLFLLIFLVAYVPNLLQFSKKLSFAYYVFFTLGLATFALFPQLQTLLFAAPPEGFFLSWTEFLLVSFPVCILILLAGKQLLAQSTHPVWSTLLFVSILFPLLHLPFYERIFIFTNLALAIFAGIAFLHLVSGIQKNFHSTRSYLSMGGIVVVLFFTIGNLVTTIENKTPLIKKEYIPVLNNIDKNLPEGATLLTTSFEAPWYMGWTHAHIAAPGMLKDNHSQEEWEEIWSNPSVEKTNALLKELPQPLFVSSFNPIEDLLGVQTPCLEPYSPNLYIFVCKQ